MNPHYSFVNTLYLYYLYLIKVMCLICRTLRSSAVWRSMSSNVGVKRFRSKPSGIQHCADWWIVTDISEEFFAYNFRAVFLDCPECGQQFSPKYCWLFTNLHEVVPGDFNLNTDVRPSNIVIKFFSLVPVAAQSKAWVCGRWPTKIAGSNPTGAMEVCCEYCLLSGRGPCDEPITRPEESHQLSCIVAFYLETQEWRGHGPHWAAAP